VSFESDLRDFQADLLALDTPAILNKHIYGTRCAALLDAQHSTLKERIAGKFNINPENIIVVGSAKLGFSIAPEKRFRAFGDIHFLRSILPPVR